MANVPMTVVETARFLKDAERAAVGAPVTTVRVPAVNVREIRTKMGLSQTQFAVKFGFPPATLRNFVPRWKPSHGLRCNQELSDLQS